MVQTRQSIEKLISEIKFRDWDIVVREFADGRPYLQVQFDAPCANTGIMERQHCAKHALSKFMTNTEVVRRAYKAVKDAVLHEMGEDFLFRGQRIYGPHLDLEKMVDFCRTTNTSKRNESE